METEVHGYVKYIIHSKYTPTPFLTIIKQNRCKEKEIPLSRTTQYW
jgi:hypothetical protein